MATLHFLLDEHVREELADALVRAEPSMAVECVGQGVAPAKGTSDSDLLKAAEANQWALITQDKTTMPGHVAAHLAAGRHTWGVFLLRRGFSMQRHVESLVLLWSASEAEEWRDVLDWVPW
jgi:hypothetical protein